MFLSRVETCEGSVCFSKRITEIISSLYLFISKEGRTPLSPEPRSVARVQPSRDPPGGVPAQPRPRSPRRAHLCPRTDTPGGYLSPPAGGRGTSHPGGRGTSHPRGCGTSRESPRGHGDESPEGQAGELPRSPEPPPILPAAEAEAALPQPPRRWLLLLPHGAGGGKREGRGRFPVSSGSVPRLFLRAAPGRRVPGSPQDPARLRTHLPPGPSAAPPPR